MSRTTTIELTREEALVLFEFLQREIDDANGARLAAIVQHQGELWALNNLNCVLERHVDELFRPDYQAGLNAAREALVETCGTWPWPTSQDQGLEEVATLTRVEARA